MHRNPDMAAFNFLLKHLTSNTKFSTLSETVFFTVNFTAHNRSVLKRPGNISSHTLSRLFCRLAPNTERFSLVFFAVKCTSYNIQFTKAG